MPNVCTEQLKPKSEFCVYHTEIAIDRGYPTTIREFLKFCGRGYFAGGAISIFLNFSGQTIRETVQEQHAVAWPPQEILLSMVWWSGLVCVLNGPEKLRKIEIALPSK